MIKGIYHRPIGISPCPYKKVLVYEYVFNLAKYGSALLDFIITSKSNLNE